MRLMELLSAECIEPELRATDKRSVLVALGVLLAKAAPHASSDAITRVLEEREALASTGLGDEVAMPHGRMPGLERVVAALALSEKGVDFDAIDRRPVRIFVGILAPEKDATGHLKALARFSRLLRDAHVRDRLLAEKSADAVFKVLEHEANRSGC